MDIKVKDLDGKEWMIPESEAEDVRGLHTDEVKDMYDDWESREGRRKGRKVARRGSRRGFAGDDVTDNQDYIEEVVPEEDDSYVVEGTDSPEVVETESEVIDDQHNVIIESDKGTEEEFMAESEDGEAELIDEDGGESREGRRKGRKVARRGSRRGESDDEIEEDIEELEEDLEDREGRRKGRKVARRGSRRGESDDEIEEDIEELEEDLEDREGRRKGRKVARRGSRRGDTVDVITDEQGNTEHVELPEPDEREGSRKGSVYGGRSPEHQESIRSAVAIAMRDRRL